MNPKQYLHQGALCGSRIGTDPVPGRQVGAPSGGSDICTARIHALYSPFLPENMSDDASSRLLIKVQREIKKAIKESQGK